MSLVKTLRSGLAWLQFLLLALLILPLLLLLPTLQQRRALTRATARLVLRLAGIRLQWACPDPLPQPCVVVANHVSYLDGVVLMAALPPHFGFVIKREVSRIPLANLLLRRIGAEFVERHIPKRSGRDALRLMRLAQQGSALAFFPEGTFGAPVGMRRFHIGAFAVAERTGLPVVPIAIQGTRECLAPDSALLLGGNVHVQVLAAIPAASGTAPELRDKARGALLAYLRDPDLAHQGQV